MKTKKKIIIGGIVGVLIVLGAIVGYQVLGNKTTNQYDESKVTVENIVNDNRFTGVIESQSRENIMATSSQKISEFYVSEGDEVEKDTDLYETSTGEVISATKSGEVSKIYYEEDDTVPAGGEVMDIVDYTNLQVSIKVDEYQLSSIAEGSPVTINIDSIGRSVQGTVSEISREAKNENGVAYFTAIVDFQGDSAIRIGMNAEVIIVKESAENALAVPVAAIQFGENNQTYVMVKNNSDTIENQNVTTGITDGVKIQITQGLNENDTVMIPKITTSKTTSLKQSATSGGN
ncbi:HlyD family efflux transporter periplasmic adaptor subunit [Acetobacterium paludosum]|uniref:HlyD family efflux transporter periplasmic adaptor subunit n=1 Tax=Acetobacterium paludosum TaxID=52693 RepID=A0A923HVZ2_9FIRM|nr:HlyD family efflux transporter periplasmic adaptor subunit [Acetobacterium paludosum]MBC3889291.1 HlyD family efflux transporter periplasmic adaptor subunit [Acetobacterium paludosum]